MANLKKSVKIIDTVILYHISTDGQIVTTDTTAVGPRSQEPLAHSPEQSEAKSNAKPRRFDKTRKTIGFVFAFNAWKRQASILKHRASFPLLRQVLRTELKQANRQIELSEITSEVLQRSLLSHIFILLFTVPATLWAAYTMTKGLSAGIRFDVWFNGWLLQGVPVFIFCAMKALTSNHSRKLIQGELVKRALTAVKE